MARQLGRRILLVEDEDTVRAVTTQILTRAGYEIVAVAAATEAMMKFVPDHFDLVMTDIGLPDIDGWQLMDAIRQFDTRVPFLVMTGYGSDPASMPAKHRGVTEVLAKPFSIVELRVTVERALVRGSRARGAKGPPAPPSPSAKLSVE